MRIACPTCAATYDVPAARLTTHKRVRCVQCGGEWVPIKEAYEVVTEPAATRQDAPALADTSEPGSPEPNTTEPGPAVTATDRLAAPTATAPSRLGLRVAWILTVVVLAGAVAATIIWRDQVIRAWPASSRILTPSGHMMPQPGHTEATKPK